MPKAKVKIVRISGNTISKPKFYPIEEGRIIIKRGGLGRGDEKYEPPYEAERIGEFGFFKRGLGFYQDGSDRLMPLTPEGEAPRFTARDIVKAGNAKLVSQQAKTNLETMPIQWITLFVMLGLAFLNYLMAVRLGIINV